MSDFQNDFFYASNEPPIKETVADPTQPSATPQETNSVSEQTPFASTTPPQSPCEQPDATNPVTPPQAPLYTQGAVPPVPNGAPVPPYGQPLYGQPQTPPPYGQPLYGQPQTPPPYGQPPYGQGAYPPPNGYASYPPVPQKKKMSAGKIIGIVLGCFFGIFLLLVVVGVVSVFSSANPEKKVEAYQQSGNLADLIDACDAYDSQITFVSDSAAAEACFAEALADTKAFHRAFPDAECTALYSDDAEVAYNVFMADYLYLMLINGNNEQYTQVFTQKMLERSASGNYYMDSYTFVGYVEDGIFELTDAQKQVVYQGFDALVAASATPDERTMNLQEYYDCCESFGNYDKADEIELLLGGSAAA